MRPHYFTFVILLIATSTSWAQQEPHLLLGPMLGHTEAHTARVWARADSAAKWGADAPSLLDHYERRLADGGYLAVRHSRWQAKGYSLQISSILWPTRGKWHRWLVLAAAGPGKKNSPAAPMVLVMDASDIPDVNAMAAAMKRILPSVSVTWKGEPKTEPANR